MDKIKKLYRSRTNRVFAGVAGGVAEYFEVDSVLMRLIFVLLAILTGFFPMVIVYLIMMVVIPKNPTQGGAQEEPRDVKDRINDFAEDIKEGFESTAEKMKKEDWFFEKRNIFGLIIVCVGLLLLLNIFIPIHFLTAKFILSVAVILVGLYLIFKNKNGKHNQ